MDKIYHFAPPRKLGFMIHLAAILILAGMVVYSIWQFLHVKIDLTFFIFLLIALVGMISLPFLIYRLYALWGAYYTVERDGIRLHWGLRVEDIPMNSIQWVYPSQEFNARSKQSLPLPLFRMPGAILGMRHITDDIQVEFFASDVSRLVIIGSGNRFFAVSPNDPQAFLYVYHRYIELGSITPIQARSLYPSFLIGEVWRDKTARYILLVGLVLNLFLLGWVSLSIPSRSEIMLGFLSDEPLQSSQLLLLPFVNSALFFLEIGFGLFLYRREPINPIKFEPNQETRRLTVVVPGKILALLLWGCNVVATALFITAVYFILLPE